MKLLIKTLAIITLVFIGILSLALIPSPQPDGPKPWEISMQPNGDITVFDIHLGQDTYQDAQVRWRESGEVALFTTEGEATTAEVFFDRINLSGLSAKIVANLSVPEETLKEMVSRAHSNKLQPSGSRRIEPAFEDKALLLTAPIVAITYIANYRPEHDVLLERFGEPTEITGDPEDPQAEIWQYPESHLSIRLHPDDKPVFEYQALSTLSR